MLRLGSEEFELVSFSLAAPQLRERLEAYLIADEVSIDDRSEAWTRISLWGDQAEAAVTKLAGLTPGLGTWGGSQNIRAFHEQCRSAYHFELLVPGAAAAGIGQALVAMGGRLVDRSAAEFERISRGIPDVPVDIGPNDLPNEGGLDEVGISYTKGCYLGQEVMARLKNLGQVRRRLHIVSGVGEPPEPGAPLFHGEKKVGEVRSVARDGSGFVAMAMLSLANLSGSGHLSLSPNGPTTIGVTRRV